MTIRRIVSLSIRRATRSFASTSRLKVEDIVIVGGGNVGLALAASLCSLFSLQRQHG